jgi:hypothetical protein
VWNSINPEYKSHYRAEIWRQFHSNVLACAQMTNDLDKFLSRLCGTFSVAVPGADAQERAFVTQVLDGMYGDPMAILKAIRNYSQAGVTQVQVWNDERKEMYKASKEQERMIVPHADN